VTPVFRQVSGILVATMIVAACTTTEPPTTTTTSTTTSETSRSTVAPEVPQPLDLQPHRLHSCALLTPEQAADLDFPPQTFEGAHIDAGTCEWELTNTESGQVEQYRYVLDVYMNGDPLAHNYREGNKRTSQGKWMWETFEPRTIRGLPAVVMAMGDPTKYCNVVVGTGGGQGIEISGNTTLGFEKPNLCESLVDAAGLIIDSVRK
jgi:hypothetical protein